MKEPTAPERLDWTIQARTRSQRLLLALYELGEAKRHRSQEERDFESDNTQLFSRLVAVAFALWRAAFLADMPTRTWPEVLRDAQELLQTVLSTDTIAFSTEHNLQGWMAGYYLINAKLRVLDVLHRLKDRGQATEADITRVEAIRTMNTDPHDTWTLLCDESERLARLIGCTFRG